MPTARTRLYALLGDPVAHSLSPQLHNAAFRSSGIDASYLALRVPSQHLAGLLVGLAHAGGGGNVTIPHKGNAVALVDAPSRRARATQACNTFWLHRGRIHGENTDVIGCAAALRTLMGDPVGLRALVIGAGGAARAAVFSLLELGASGITVMGRSPRRAREMTAVAGHRARRVVYTVKSADIAEEGFDVVINATPLGLGSRDRLPIRFERLAGLRAAFDMVYKPGGTRWTNYARSIGIPAIDGSEMLIQQAAAAFELWFDVDAPVAAMRAAIRKFGAAS